MKLLSLFCTLIALVASHKTYHDHKVGEGEVLGPCPSHLLVLVLGFGSWCEVIH